MVHPCIPNYGEDQQFPSTELHACHSSTSTKTLCKRREITADDIDKTDGAQSLCPDCYPFDKTPPGQADPKPIPR